MYSLSVLSGPTRPDFLRDETLVDIFDMTVDRCGDRTALKFRGRSMSYAELATATQSVAAQLVGLGVAPTDRVGIWCDQGPLVPAAMIGVMRAGAVYVPCHRDIPRERLALVIEDAGIEILVVDKNTSNLCEGLCSKQLIIGEDLFIRDGTAVKPLLRSFAKADAPAYIIYTSGSTGRPKGVMVSHTQACHWLRSEHSALGIQERDVVYQGFSPAFDMSIEEIWTSLLTGASLVVAEGDIAKDVEAIGPLLREHAVTVLHAVPSLAALINPDLPALRLLNLGGEAVGAAIVSRWARPGLRIVNTYGPTEGTVSCTLGELTPDKPVTIGQPLPNYRIYIVDEEGCLVPRGRTGELWIGGPSVATGYVGLPALNAERFKPDPFSPAGDKAGRIYRTGDQAMIGLDGDITYLGRLDGQVKIRGYRVELGEIEKVLGAAPNVKLAAITTRTSNLDETEIIGFVVPTPGHAFDVAELRKYLRKHLNSYMIPSQLHVVDDLPRMSSGKLDRQGMMGKIAGRKVSNPNFTPREKQLADALRPFLSDIDLEPHSDFFDDLGGHSLLMARFVSSLRRYPELAKVSLRDIYQARNLRTLANLINARAAMNEPAPAMPACKPSSAVTWRYILCGAAQALALVGIFGLNAAAWLTPFFGYLITYEWTDSILYSSLTAVTAMFVLPFVLLLGGIGAKWLIIGRMKAGDYPLWGLYYFRCWLVDRLFDLMPLGLLANSPLYAPALAALGARIGNHVHIGSCTIGAIDLLTIGDGSSLGNGVHINNKTFDSNTMRLRPVVLGRNTYVGPAAVLNGGCHIGDHSEVGDMAQVSADTGIGTGEIWGGSPARNIGTCATEIPDYPKPKLVSRVLLYSLYTCLVGLLVLCAFVPVLPAIITTTQLDKLAIDGNFNLLAAEATLAPLFGFIYTVLFAVVMIGARWLLLGRVKPGTYAVHSLFYARKWFVDGLFEMSLSVLHTLFATLYLPLLYRLMGAKIGRWTEISTATNVTHDLLEIGDEAFVADSVVLGDSRIRHGVMTLRRTHLGDRCFVGNAAVVPDGRNLPNGSLVGVLSLAPDNNDSASRPGSTWFGIPSTELPRRETFLDYPEALTFRPSRARWLARAAVEMIRILLPSSVIICELILLTGALYDISERFGLAAAIAGLPFLYFAIVALPALAIVVALKWLLVGRYKTGAHPMWTPFVWFSEGVTTVVEALLTPLLLSPLQGTPFLAWPLRLLGVKVGRQALINTTDITEFDMVTIGDQAVLSDDCGPQTHLFEDRVMKVGPVTIGARAVIGARAIPLYDTIMGDGSYLAPQSLLMKGEELPDNSRWSGAPAEPL